MQQDTYWVNGYSLFLINNLKNEQFFFMKSYLILLLLFTSCHTMLAQTLQRKGSIGVKFYQNIPDTLAKQLEYTIGAIIEMPVPDATAYNIGVLKNDIIIKVNQTYITNGDALVAVAKTLRANDPIKITVLRKGKEVTLSGVVVARPKETSPTADIVYGEFAYKNGLVRTILKSTKNTKPIGTIYYLQGLPCYSMDNFQPFDKTKEAIDAMVDRGFAVYRMEKGDMGDNQGFGPCSTMGYTEELEMYTAGYKNLLKLPSVDIEKIFLFGHSMGGTTAPVLAAQFQPRGVAVYGTGFKPWAEYLCDAYIIQSVLYGEDEGECRATLEKLKPYFYDYMYNNKPLEAIIQTPNGLLAMQTLLSYNPVTKQGASGRSMSTFKELNKINAAKGFSQYQHHVLAMYGECDVAANNANDNIAMIEHVNKQHPGKGTFWLVPKTSHMFEKVGTMQEYITMSNNPAAYQQYAATRFSAEVFDYTRNWMKALLQKPLAKK